MHGCVPAHLPTTSPVPPPPYVTPLQVLDEADRLLNMDFEQEIDQILKVIPKASANTVQCSMVAASCCAGLLRLRADGQGLQGAGCNAEAVAVPPPPPSPQPPLPLCPALPPPPPLVPAGAPHAAVLRHHDQQGGQAAARVPAGPRQG